MMKIKITQETLTAMSPVFGFKIHGDIVKGDRISWDLEFSDMIRAVAFANAVMLEHSIDIRFGDKADSLFQSVVLTMDVERVGNW